MLISPIFSNLQCNKVILPIFFLSTPHKTSENIGKYSSCKNESSVGMIVGRREEAGGTDGLRNERRNKRAQKRKKKKTSFCKSRGIKSNKRSKISSLFFFLLFLVDCSFRALSFTRFLFLDAFDSFLIRSQNAIGGVRDFYPDSFVSFRSHIWSRIVSRQRFIFLSNITAHCLVSVRRHLVSF